LLIHLTKVVLKSQRPHPRTLWINRPDSPPNGCSPPNPEPAPEATFTFARKFCNMTDVGRGRVNSSSRQAVFWELAEREVIEARLEPEHDQPVQPWLTFSV
jgi:hypothetical protein